MLIVYVVKQSWDGNFIIISLTSQVAGVFFRWRWGDLATNLLLALNWYSNGRSDTS